MVEVFPRLAIIGCGAIVEGFYLPALRTLGWKPVLLVDPDVDRVSEIARLPRNTTICGELEDRHLNAFDAALVATPNSLHASITRDLLLNGKHVLVEKPITVNAHTCAELIEIAEHSNLVLASSLVLRYVKSNRWLRGLIRSGSLGQIEHFYFLSSSEFSWPIKTDAIWRRDASGGGVLIDIGAHILDLMIWWFGEVLELDYRDDSFGGVEADCLLRVSCALASNGTVELSRSRDLGTTAKVTGAQHSFLSSLFQNEISGLDCQFMDAQYEGAVRAEFGQQSFDSLFRDLLSDWQQAITGGGTPMASGQQALASIELIEKCYRNRQTLVFPWVERV